MSNLKIEASRCDQCAKKVFPMEEVRADQRIWHKWCFRCKKCNNVLSLKGFASMQGEFFCKPCFKKNFFEKGNYSEGFGKMKPQQEWASKSESPNASPAPFVPGPEPSQASTEPKKESPAPEPTPAPVSEAKKEAAPEPKKEEAAPEPKKEEVAPEPKKEAAPEPKKESPAPVSEAKKEAAPEPKKEEAAPEPKKEAETKKISFEAEDAKKPSPLPTLGISISPQLKRAKTKQARPSSMYGLGSVTGAPPSPPKPAVPKCQACAKSVYKMEELIADEQIFHKSCFRCKDCNSVMSLKGFASMGGEFWCKNCFKKAFHAKGNYASGFGKKTPQEQFNEATGKAVYSMVGEQFKGVGKHN